MHTLRTFQTLTLTLLLAFAAAACGADAGSDVSAGGDDSGGSTAPPLDAGTTAPDGIFGVTWLFLETVVGGDAIVPVDGAPTITFEGDQVSGFGGCNTFGGDATFADDGSTVSLSNIFMTEIGCEDPDWTGIFDLSRTWDITFEGVELVLTATDGSGAGVRLTPDAGSAGGEPKLDNPLGDAISGEYVGLTEAEALAQAEADGSAARVVMRDGEGLPVTLDIQEDRLNFTVVDDIVTDSYFG